MPVEIERKFLVRDESWRIGAVGPFTIVQGYFCVEDHLIGRVRKIGDRAYLALKGKKVGFTRPEFEYEIPVDDAESMLALFCRDPLIFKERFESRSGGRTWLVDAFQGKNEGLVLAEVELATEADVLRIPDWAGFEVTGVVRYRNSRLARSPFRDWSWADRHFGKIGATPVTEA